MQYPKTVKLYLSGNWFHAYDDDAKVVSFITNFKLYEDYQKLCPTVGFPYDSLTKVEGLLRENKINYVLLNHTNKFIDYKEENNYDKFLFNDLPYSYVVAGTKVKRKLYGDFTVQFDEEPEKFVIGKNINQNAEIIEFVLNHQVNDKFIINDHECTLLEKNLSFNNNQIPTKEESKIEEIKKEKDLSTRIFEALERVKEISERNYEAKKYQEEDKEYLYASFEEEEANYLKEGEEIFTKFKEEYFKLAPSSYNEVFRVDLIYKLFEDFFYKDGKLYFNKEINCRYYINAISILFDFLIMNYHNTPYSFNIEDLKFEGFERNLNELCEPIKEYLDDDYDAYYEFLRICDRKAELSEKINEFMLFLYNKFDKNFVKDLITLYKYQTIRTIGNDENIEDFLHFLLIKVNMKEELFDFLNTYPNQFKISDINLIYDSRSAKIVFNIINNQMIYFEKFESDLNLYYDILINTFEKYPDDEFSKNILNALYDFEFKNKPLMDKIKLFRYLEIKLFDKYFDSYKYRDQSLTGKPLMTFSYYDEPHYHLEEIKDIKFDDDIGTDCESYDEICSMKQEIPDDLNDKLYNKDLDIIKFDNTIGMDSRLYDELYSIEQEMICVLYDKSYAYSLFKDIINNYKEVKNIKELLNQSEDLVIKYEFEEIQEKYNNKIDFDKDIAINQLEQDLTEINTDKYDKIINELLKYSKVSKTLLSASYLWHIFINNNNDIEKDGQEYTPLIANYFKTVELLLLKKIKNGYKLLIQSGEDLKVPYNCLGQKIDLLDQNEEYKFTLGEMAKYIKREPKLMKDGFDNEELYEKLNMWIENVRNSHFHTDLILSKTKTKILKKETLEIIVDIINYII